jgi:hypothetical protein
MRPSPSFQIFLQHFGVWRGAVGLVASCSVLVLVFWGWCCDLPPAGWLGVVVICAGAVGLGVPLVRTPQVGLRWDGQLWRLGSAQACASDPSADTWLPGHLVVCMDLCFWMLLRFTPSTSEPKAPVIWLPVQRWGLETNWHRLRCSVYSPCVPMDVQLYE